jgi:hypothetical protein
MIERREAIRRLAAAGAAGAGILGLEPSELLAALGEPHTHVAPLTRTRYRFAILTPHQRQTIVTLAEMIIPTTETPGAKDAGIDEFADVLVAEWFNEGERNAFMEGLLALDATATQKFGKTFVAAAPAQRTEQLTAMADEWKVMRDARLAWRRESGSPQPADHRRTFFHQFRSLTVSGYYSSEAGYTKERKAALIPGIYKPCMPASEA